MLNENENRKLSKKIQNRFGSKAVKPDRNSSNMFKEEKTVIKARMRSKATPKNTSSFTEMSIPKKRTYLFEHSVVSKENEVRGQFKPVSETQLNTSIDTKKKLN